MISLLLYTFSVFGIWYVIGYSQITFRARDYFTTLWLKKDLSKRYGRAPWYINLIQCPACSGFWLGLISGLAFFHMGIYSIILALYTVGTNALLGALATGDN